MFEFMAFVINLFNDGPNRRIPYVDHGSAYSLYCVKSVHIRSFFRSIFSRIYTKYGVILRISPYSVRIGENMDQESSKYGILYTVLHST